MPRRTGHELGAIPGGGVPADGETDAWGRATVPHLTEPTSTIPPLTRPRSAAIGESCSPPHPPWASRQLSAWLSRTRHRSRDQGSRWRTRTRFCDQGGGQQHLQGPSGPHLRCLAVGAKHRSRAVNPSAGRHGCSVHPQLRTGLGAPPPQAKRCPAPAARPAPPDVSRETPAPD